MSVFNILKSKERKYFEHQLEYLEKSKISLFNADKKDIISKLSSEHTGFFDKIKIPRNLFLLLDTLSPERLSTLTLLRYHVGGSNEFKRLASIICNCVTINDKNNIFPAYDTASLILSFLIRQYFGQSLKEKQLAKVICTLFNKFKKAGFIDVSANEEDFKFTSDVRFFLGIFKKNFGLRISPSYNVDENNNILMRHGDKYSIHLFNDNESLRANVVVYIDNKEIGKFRIEKESSIRIERPVNDDGYFTFYEYGTREGFHAGIKNGMGKIKCKFYQEQPWKSEIMYSLAEGGTGLSGKSEQKFTQADHINVSNEYTEINARLISYKEKPRKLV